MSETHVAHTKPLSRMQSLSESRGGSKVTNLFLVIVQSAIQNSFNFICSFVLCFQPCVLYSTDIQHSTRYSIFNFPFNIQLFILNSIIHSSIQLPIQLFQLYIQNSIIQLYSFNIQLFVSVHSSRSAE